MSNDRIDETLPASNGDASAGTDATQASEQVDATMPSDAGTPASGPPKIRAGRAEDYAEFLAVDPKHYVVGKEIARGGMGRILAARDRRLGRPVAIKELLYESGDARARFEREARITAKLQHPAIVNIIEAGAWPSGEPFYVMKLVTGESLDVVIAGRTTIAARLGLLPNVIAAVDALAYAHSKQVIHRDLKPGNVLVGEFGETVVIDWGLAKDLADDDADAPSAGPHRHAGPGETRVGSVMGTPAYMPSEQAIGEGVDQRADVYSLGAMLYHVLAGVPPYRGRTSEEVLELVIKGPPPPLATRAPGVPPDLVTIVEKAMAHDAAGRYPTAKELSDDLKKFQTGQLVGAHRYSTWQLVRRWIRRHRTPVAVGAIAAVLLAVVGVVSLQRIFREQERTDAQRRVAEESRGEAEDLLGFMLVDLRDKLRPLARLDLLDAVAKKAVTYYDRRDDDLSDPELAKRALARTNLGDVLSAQGHTDEALREYRTSLAAFETLAAKDPTNAQWQPRISASHNKVGDMVLEQGDTAAALASYRSALAITETLAAQDPTNAERQHDLSITHNKISGVLLVQGDAAGAHAASRASLAIAETLAAQDPSNADRQHDLAASRIQVGDVLRKQGDAAGALASYRAALTIDESLAAQDPTNAERQRDLSLSHNKVGNVLAVQGDAAGALASFRASLAIRETLATKDPTNARRQRDLSFSHARVGELLLGQGDLAGALDAYRASLAICETLAAKDPTSADRQQDLSNSHIRVGDVLIEQGDAAGALAAYRVSLAIATTLAASDPTNAERQRDLAVGQGRVGDVMIAQGDAAGALTSYRAMLAIDETLAAADPTSAERQRDVAVCHHKVGSVLSAQGDVAGALAAFRAGLAIAERLAAQDPTNAEWQRDLAVSHQKVGTSLLAQGTDHAEAAIASLRASQALFETLAANEPTSAGRQLSLAEIHWLVGQALVAQGDATAALASFRAWLAIAETLVARDPTSVAFQVDLALSHEMVGDTLVAQADKGYAVAARAEYEAALAIMRRVQAKDPSDAGVGELVANLAAKTATCCAKGTTR